MRLDEVIAFEGVSSPHLHRSVIAYEPVEGGGFSKKLYLSAKDAAIAYGISVHSVYRLMRDGKRNRRGVSFQPYRLTRKRAKASNSNGSERNG